MIACLARFTYTNGADVFRMEDGKAVDWWDRAQPHEMEACIANLSRGTVLRIYEIGSPKWSTIDPPTPKNHDLHRSPDTTVAQSMSEEPQESVLCLHP